MSKRPVCFAVIALTALTIIALFPIMAADGVSTQIQPAPMLWRDPGPMAARDLYCGQGSAEVKPEGPFVFVREDLDGTNPKFDVVDRNGIEWKVKLGVEARPEVAASRIMWAVGYYVRESYFFPLLHVDDMPEQLQRGQELIGEDGSIHGARLKRSPPRQSQNFGSWRWKANPFKGTREFDGLRVMMALLSNLDVKDSNNRIFREQDPDGSGRILDIYMVHDLGGSFSSHLWPYSNKGNLKSYKSVEFLKDLDQDTVDLNLPTGPEVVDLARVPWYIYRIPLRWISRDIPREHARWIGNILGQLSAEQIGDAFRAGGYSPDDVQGFTEELMARIALLNSL